MFAGLSCFFWKEQGTLEALGTVAIGMVELKSGMHRHADGTTRSAVRQAGKGRFAVLVEWNRRDAAMASWCLIHVPRIIGRIRRQIGGKLLEGHDGLLRQGTKIGDIAFVEGQGVLSQHHGSIVRMGRNGDASAITPNQFFLLVGRAIGQFLVGAALDPQASIGIAC